jgi:hypothetical protein
MIVIGVYLNQKAGIKIYEMRLLNKPCNNFVSLLFSIRGNTIIGVRISFVQLRIILNNNL